jgi:hypothetical protein
MQVPAGQRRHTGDRTAGVDEAPFAAQWRRGDGVQALRQRPLVQRIALPGKLRRLLCVPPITPAALIEADDDVTSGEVSSTVGSCCVRASQRKARVTVGCSRCPATCPASLTASAVAARPASSCTDWPSK